MSYVEGVMLVRNGKIIGVGECNYLLRLFVFGD